MRSAWKAMAIAGALVFCQIVLIGMPGESSAITIFCRTGDTRPACVGNIGGVIGTVNPIGDEWITEFLINKNLSLLSSLTSTSDDEVIALVGDGGVVLYSGTAEQVATQAQALTGALPEGWSTFTTSDLGGTTYLTAMYHAPAPVPEPSTMLLLGSGLAGLAGIGRRKFRKSESKKD